MGSILNARGEKAVHVLTEGIVTNNNILGQLSCTVLTASPLQTPSGLHAHHIAT